MRALAASGNPNYGDATNGVTIVKQLSALDTQFHWFTIAELYQVDGSEDVFLSDRARFRIKLVGAKIMADVAIGLDLTLPRDKLLVTTQNVIQNVGYDLFGDSDVASTVQMPQFRVVWNDTGAGPMSGAFLQLGITLPGLSETIAIEDYSGIESAWKILPAAVPNTPDGPADDTITLPDGASIWDALSGDSYSVVKTMPTARPYRLFEGAQALNTFDVDDDITHLLPSYFQIEDIKSAQIVITDTNTGSPYVINIPMTSLAPGQLSGRVAITQAGTDLSDDVILTLTKVGAVITANMGPASGAVWGAGAAGHTVNYILVQP